MFEPLFARLVVLWIRETHDRCGATDASRDNLRGEEVTLPRLDVYRQAKGTPRREPHAARGQKRPCTIWKIRRYFSDGLGYV